MNLIDFPTKRQLPRRTLPISAVVIHTTGETDLDAILGFYSSANGYQPHYLIETLGTVRRIVQEDHVAYHAAIYASEAAAYQRGFGHWSTLTWDAVTEQPKAFGGVYPGYATWKATWLKGATSSPLDLVTRGHPNAVSIGVELQQPTQAELTPDIFTFAQYEALAELLTDVSGRNTLPLDRRHLLGHYDVSPMRRSTSRGGWDPGERFNWNHLLTQLHVNSSAHPIPWPTEIGGVT
jgi:N-acetyl-anhydromuramyl-L-alanine amidase AmpD